MAFLRRRNRKTFLQKIFSPFARHDGLTPDYQFLVISIILLLAGLLILSSATSVISFERSDHETSYLFLWQQLTHGVAPGIIFFLFFANIDYRLYKKYSFFLLVLTIALLVAVFIPSVGIKLNGVRGWIHLGGITIQTSEIAKLTFIIWLTAWLSQHQSVMKSFKKTTLPFATVIAIICLLLILQPDMGTILLVITISFTLYLIAGSSLLHFAALTFTGLAASVAMIVAAPYRFQRILTFWNPAADVRGAGYQIYQGLIAIGSGFWFGVGIGQSRQKFSYIPEVASDSIFAVIGEEWGFILSAILVGLYAALFLRGLRIALRCPDLFGSLLVTGITLLITIQALVNIGAIIGVLPLTGLPLPFVSLGGTNIVVLLSGIGIIMNVSRFSNTHG